MVGLDALGYVPIAGTGFRGAKLAYKAAKASNKIRKAAQLEVKSMRAINGGLRRAGQAAKFPESTITYNKKIVEAHPQLNPVMEAIGPTLVKTLGFTIPTDIIQITSDLRNNQIDNNKLYARNK